MQDISLVTKCFILNDSGELLILKRSMDSPIRPGGWDLAGGKVEKHEDPNMSILREISEETSLKVGDARVVYISSELASAFIITLFYVAKYIEQTINLSDEHTEFRWITKQEFRLLDIPKKFLLASEHLY